MTRPTDQHPSHAGHPHPYPHAAPPHHAPESVPIPQPMTYLQPQPERPGANGLGPREYAIAVFLLLLGGGSGWVGRSVASEDPAVLASTLSDVRKDVARVEADVRSLHVLLRSVSDDRFRASDHKDWLDGTWTRHLDDHARHERQPGHAEGISRLEQLERRVELLEREP